MTLKIAQLGQPVLRNVAEPVDPSEIGTAAFQQFLDTMYQTLREKEAAGLAGPQVFRGQRVFLAAILPASEDEDAPEVEFFINPRLSELSEDKASAWEGCLSFIELLTLVPRHRSLRVDYLDRHGQPKALQLRDFPARVIQHEYDHLDGVLTIDRAASTQDVVKASEIDTVLAERKARRAAPSEDAEMRGRGDAEIG